MFSYFPCCKKPKERKQKHKICAFVCTSGRNIKLFYSNLSLHHTLSVYNMFITFPKLRCCFQLYQTKRCVIQKWLCCSRHENNKCSSHLRRKCHISRLAGRQQNEKFRLSKPHLSQLHPTGIVQDYLHFIFHKFLTFPNIANLPQWITE